MPIWVFGQAESVKKIKNIGLPFITNYGPSDYNLTNQNFDVLIGDDGKIYFANNGGILVFDGVNWSQLILPKKTEVYALTKADDGVIYVGGVNEFGYLSNTMNGELEYISLVEKLSDESLESFVSLPMVSGDRIIFSAGKKTIIINRTNWKYSLIDCPDKSGKFYTMNQSHGSIYAYTRDTLFQLNERKWEKVRHLNINYAFGSGLFLDLDSQKTISITKNGYFDFQTEEKINIPKDVETFLQKSTIYSVSRLLDKYIVICTWEGLLITDFSGNPILHLNKEKGLPDNFLFNSALDDSGNLWVATNNGIAKIDLFSACSIFDKRMGVEGVITDAQLFDENLYLTSISGVSSENWGNLRNPFFIPSFNKLNAAISHGTIKTNDEIFLLTELNGTLVLKNGVFEVVEETLDDIYWAGFKSRKTDDLILGSYSGKLIHLSKNQGKWKIKAKIDPMFLNARYMAEGSGNDIWASNANEGIFKLSYDIKQGQLLNEKKYGEAEGLPSDLNNYVFTINSEPLFATEKGIYKYDLTTDLFAPNRQYSDLIGEVPVSLISEDEDGNIYYFSNEFNLLKKTASGYKKTTFLNIDFQKYIPIKVTAVDSKNILVSSLDALIHIDPTQSELQPDFEVRFANFSSLTSDSSFYAGFGAKPKNISFEPDDNSIRFEFSTTYYKNIDQTTFRWRLVGFESEWSQWSSETQKDYTNLPHGEYTFEIVGKNVFGKKSKPATFKFIIGTPWFLSFTAYVIYFLGFCLLVWLLVKFYSRKLIADRTRLELIVEDRTKEINEQRNKLLQMDDLKKRFFVNISHELRTPLTLSMGTVDQALKGNYGSLNDELYANLQVSKRNSERLLKMVTSILDISKLEGGKIQLCAAPVDPIKTVRKVLAFFSSRLTDKHITLEETLIDETELYLDEDKFETILINLISNAFKFTPNGGKISFTMRDLSDHIVFEIKDSGEGIPEEDVKLVFDRFYQSPTIKSGEGMGVGLALTRELVELHHGRVEAKNDHGAVFRLSFLKGKDHLSPNQIIEYHESSVITNLADKYPLYDDRDITIIPEKEPDSQLEHILLVEDNTEMRQFISSILSPHYRVSWAEDGSKGLAFLKENRPDLIITDYLMPNMDGYEMAVEIKKQEDLAFIPIVFLTARTREQDKINVLNLGVDDYLFKPFSADELLVRIKNLLFNKKHRAEYIEEQEIDSSDIEWKEFGSKIKADLDQYIMDHMREEITGDQLATQTGHSERSLYRKVKANTGLSLMQYVREFRLRQARSLLENKEFHTVSEVSYAVGFNYLSHFTKNYKERFGKQPSEYLD